MFVICSLVNNIPVIMGPAVIF